MMEKDWKLKMAVSHRRPLYHPAAVFLVADMADLGQVFEHAFKPLFSCWERYPAFVCHFPR